MLDEFFGSPAQKGLQRRAAAMWTLLQDDPAYCCHGRAVGVTDPAPTSLAQQISLARLQGVSSCEGVSAADAAARRAALEAAGLALDEYVSWVGRDRAIRAAQAVLASRSLPEGLQIRQVDADTPAVVMQQLDRVTASCEVLLPMGQFLRGLTRPAVCVYAQTDDGEVVATSAGVAQFHPDSSRGREFWWGMLATDDRFRGQGLAILLGAESMVRMVDRHGMTGFFTGIRAGNAPSERLCSKLGLEATDRSILISIAPEVFAQANVTK
ncbi:GNAT family N-acetyltransferase [Nioella aestuarii]|uniref:GNAT family N-acetyltransferase n=1 Tax=Nioella aestuarii TaxID=1662864 RepID=UPI003D7F58D8